MKTRILVMISVRLCVTSVRLCVTSVRLFVTVAMLCTMAGSTAQELPEQLIVVTARDQSVPVFPPPFHESKILMPAMDSERVRLVLWEPVPAPLGELRGIPREEEFPLPAEL